MKKSKSEKASKSKDGVDMISNLPDPILHSILSHVPTTEEVVRTSILSRRWMYFWTSVPSIDICLSRGLNPHEEFKKNKFKEFVCRVLTSNSLDLDSFHLSCVGHYNMSTIGEWIDAAVRRNIKVLDLMYRDESEYLNIIELPHCLLTCRWLEVLKLALCSLRLSLPRFTGFPALRVLELKSVRLTNQDLVKEFLKNCPLLEDLCLVDCLTRDFNLFCISCPKLIYLRIDNWTDYYPHWQHADMSKRLQICCPKLVFLEFSGFIAGEFIFESLDSLKKAVVRTDRTFEWWGYKIWELFAGISHVEYLSLSGLKYITLKDLPKSLPNLKTLELTTKFDPEKMDVLIKILTSSPNLEFLHINIEEGSLNSSSPAEASRNDFLKMECTLRKLKMVKLSGISAVPPHILFIEFLLERTPFLETISITPSVNTTDGKSSFLTELLRFQRASLEAEIIFV